MLHKLTRASGDETQTHIRQRKNLWKQKTLEDWRSVFMPEKEEYMNGR